MCIKYDLSSFTIDANRRWCLSSDLTVNAGAEYGERLRQNAAFLHHIDPDIMCLMGGWQQVSDERWPPSGYVDH